MPAGGAALRAAGGGCVAGSAKEPSFTERDSKKAPSKVTKTWSASASESTWLAGGGALSECGSEQSGELTAPGKHRPHALLCRPRLDQLLLGQHRDVEAAGLSGHQLVGGFLEHSHELHHPLDGVSGRFRDRRDRAVEVSDVSRGVALHERAARASLESEW